jgi:glucose-1-phosphate cytidylyltransferase
MKTVILCGGRGTRLGKHGATVPKALINIGDKPIIHHLLKIYSHYGINEFVLCLGFLGNEIKHYFVEQEILNEDFTLDSSHIENIFPENPGNENWRITFAETGLDTNTGGRLKKVEKYLANEEIFCVTYGDGLADVDIKKLIEFHKSHGKIATLTAVHPHSNFGLIKVNEENAVTEFQEKPKLTEWVNGGFFIFNREVFDYLDENSILEHEPLEKLANQRQLMAFPHTGFWKCMDTYKDNIEFNQLWEENPIWKVWKN